MKLIVLTTLFLEALQQESYFRVSGGVSDTEQPEHMSFAAERSMTEDPTTMPSTISYNSIQGDNIFPNMSGTVWMWSYDGKHPRGILEFLADGKIKYRLEKREGGWTIEDSGSILVANFGGEEHILGYFGQYEVAILWSPIRDPRSRMYLLKGLVADEKSYDDKERDESSDDKESETANKTVRWRADGRCGWGYPLSDGVTPAECDPDSIHPCCSLYGWCGNSQQFCTCSRCTDFRIVKSRREITEQLEQSRQKGNCTTVIVNNFLKYACSEDENGEGFYFKCGISNITYSTFTKWGKDSRGRFAHSLSGVSETCPGDFGGYQACGFTEKQTVSKAGKSVLCGGYFCDNGEFQKPFIRCNQNCLEDRTCPSSHVDENEIGLCNDKCEMWETCADESDCNGYKYGITCSWESGEHLPVHYICDGREHCPDGADERGCYGHEMDTTLQTCPQWISRVSVPIMNNTRCSAFQMSEGGAWTYPYCWSYLDQTNCTDEERVGGYCPINGAMSSVSKFVVCHDYGLENPRLPIQLCDDDFQNKCFTLGSAECRVHKHRQCDGIYDCPDKSDEYLDICNHMIDTPDCVRRFSPAKIVKIPIAWIMDNETDCRNEQDERSEEWNFCGDVKEKTRRVNYKNESCANVFMCPGSAANNISYVEFDILCDGIDSCGIENQVCQAARSFPQIDKFAIHSENMRDLCGPKNTFHGKQCDVKEFKRLSANVFGATTVGVNVPTSKVDCSGLFGEVYVYLSCLDLCENAACPLENNHLLYDSCPGQIADRVYSLTNNSHLTFLEKSDSGTYQQDYFQCNNSRCIKYHQMCDLIDDCGDMSDELGCANHMICEDTGNLTKKQLISLSQRCDGIYDCFDLSDECNTDCGKQILENWVLKILCWAMGVLAVLFNAITTVCSAVSLRSCRTDSMLTSKALCTIISFGDFLIGVYLIILSTFDTLVYGDRFCRHQAQWLSGPECAFLGVISTIGSQISVFAMTVLSSIRMIGLSFRSLSAPRSVGKKAVLSTSILVLAVVVAAVAIAVVPLAPFLEDYFVQGMFYNPDYKVFIGFPNKVKHVSVLRVYYNSANFTADLTWKEIGAKVDNMFSYQYGKIERRAVHFYGNDGLCLFKYFVRSDDARRSRGTLALETDIVDNKANAVVWLMLALNLLCFIVITVSYVLIIRKTKRSSKRTGRSKDPSAASQNQALQNRITVIVATDFLCWVPFIIISALHNLEVIDATYWYVTFAMIVLPLNSVLNPLIYDNTIKDAAKNILHGRPIFLNKQKNASISRSTKVESINLTTRNNFTCKSGLNNNVTSAESTKGDVDKISQEDVL
ncbi:hypothetical protein ACHWQZ_G010999 [Mnemiopsis leidyi]